MKVAVFGAGTMGSGIAQVFATAGNETLLFASSVESAKRHKDKLAKSLEKRVEKGKMTAEAKDAILNNIKTVEIEEAADCDLVLETIKEEIGAKRELLEKLDAMCKPETIFATNTSSLSITQIAYGLNHPVVGMHFFNPAPTMKLVEVIAGMTTPAEVVEQIKVLSTELGKTPVEVNEAPGFVVNRILIPMINEAICLLESGVASAADIDVAMQLGANHPMGPLALSDLIGNDIVLNIMDVLYTETGDSKYRASVLLRKMVRGGNLGRKTKKGFFSYEK
jgi:3-hydroxybutyryl-CoA dehydrogenase